MEIRAVLMAISIAHEATRVYLKIRMSDATAMTHASHVRKQSIVPALMAAATLMQRDQIASITCQNQEDHTQQPFARVISTHRTFLVHVPTFMDILCMCKSTLTPFLPGQTPRALVRHLEQVNQNPP
ncbi:hypothetical protein AWENTII_005446 [Aspergillus wentii]